MEEQLRLINVSEGLVELNYGMAHHDLKPGDVTPYLSVPEANSYLVRNPDSLKIFNEAEGLLEDPENLETFPEFTKGVDEEDAPPPPSVPQESTSIEIPDEEPDEDLKPQQSPAVKPSSKKKKG